MKRLELYLALDHGFTHAVMLGVPVLILGLALDGDYDRATLVTWFALGGMAYGFGALPAGWFAARDPGATLSGGLALAAVGLALAGIAAAELVPPLVGPALIVTGAGLAAYHPAGIGVLAERYPQSTGRALARNGIGGNVGQVAGPLLAGAWIWLTPAAVFLLFAGMALALLAFGYGVAPRGGRRAGRAALRPLLTAPVMLMQLASTANGFAFRAVMVLLPLVLYDHLDASAEHATLVAAAMVTAATLAGIPGNLLAGPAIDRFGPAPLVAVTNVLVLAGVALYAAALTGMLPGGLWLAAVGVALFGAATYGSQPALNTLLAQLTGPEGRSMLYGVTFALRFGVSFGAPLLVLALTPWLAAPATMTLLAALAVVPALMVARTISRRC